MKSTIVLVALVLAFGPRDVALAADSCPDRQASVFYRYVGDGEKAAIETSHVIHSNNPQGTYYTDCKFASGRDAQTYLALRAAPTFRVAFHWQHAACKHAVASYAGQPGGGMECVMPQPNTVPPFKRQDPQIAVQPLGP